MNRESLFKLLDSPQRRLIVIFGTFGIGVVAILPLVDNYKEKLGELARLGSELRESTHEVASLEEYQQKRNAAIAELAAFQERVVKLEDSSEYHQHIVEIARQTNCRVVRISDDEIMTRPWIAGGNPLSRRQAKKSDPVTPYELVSQRVSLSIRGLPQDINRFLEVVKKEDKLSHTMRFNIHPENSERETVILELDYWLLSLQRKAKRNAVANQNNQASISRFQT